jgi:hypothetical protein
MAVVMRVVGWEYGPASRDADGNREYKLLVKTRTDDPDGEGPAVALQLVDSLVAVGDYWNPPGTGDEIDVYAFRRQEAAVRTVEGEGEKVANYVVEITFSTKADTKQCKDTQIDNPLLQPQRINGSFSKYTEEATKDRFGVHIQNSAHEQIRGPQNEWDANRPGVEIEQNVADLELPLLTALTDCVNDQTMWGLPARTIKFVPGPWEVKYYGTCTVYYTRKLTFEIRYEGWDRDIMDEGTKALNGRWSPTGDFWEVLDIAGSPPDPDNPQHFIRYKDRNGENTKGILNGAGVPISVEDPGTSTSTGTAAYRYPGTIHVERYPSANLLLLGIPSALPV